jgi:hypothetical protein
VRLTSRGADALLDLRDAALRTGRSLDRASALTPVRDVHVIGVYAPDGADLMARAVAVLRGSRHRVRVSLGALGPADVRLHDLTVRERLTAGKLANVNELAAVSGAARADWIVLIDDDVELGPRFLDRMICVAEAFGLELAQPALTRASHTAWNVTRRHPALVRRTPFVEVGPVTMMAADVFCTLSPFPTTGMAWGVDLHWAAVARRRGWGVGVVDAVPVRHDARATASTYRWQDAAAAAREFLGRHDHLRYADADRTLSTHRRLSSA